MTEPPPAAAAERRLLFLNNQGLASVGGGVTILRHLVADLAVDHQVAVWSFDAPGDAPSRVEQRTLPQPSAPAGPLWRFAPRHRAAFLARTLPCADIAGFDVVVCLDCHFARALRRCRPRRLIYVSLSCIPRQETAGRSGIDAWLVFAQYAALERAMVGVADRTIVASRLQAAEMQRCERLRRFAPVILHPVFPARSSAAPRDQRPTVTILSAGRLVPLKNYAVVPALAARLRDLPCRFVIAGDGPEAEPIRARAATLGVADRVELVGASHDVEALLRDADIFLHPSRYESFGIAVFEAMRAGVPPVCAAGAAVTACAEFVTDGVDGCFVDFDRLDDAAETLRRLVIDGDRRAAMAAAARRSAERRLEPGYTAQFRHIVEGLAAGGAGTP